MRFNYYNINTRIKMAYHRYFKTVLCVYIIKRSSCPSNETYQIRVAESLYQLSTIKCNDDFLRTAQKRFSIGHRLFFYCDNEKIVGTGWITRKTSSFYAWEIANAIHFQNSVEVLYDFYVHPDFRRRGIYKSLLRSIINDSIEKDSLFAIYAESSNYASNKAIVDTGFELVGQLSHFSNNVIIKKE